MPLWVFGSEIITQTDLCKSSLNLEGEKKSQPKETTSVQRYSSWSYTFWDGRVTLENRCLWEGSSPETVTQSQSQSQSSLFSIWSSGVVHKTFLGLGKESQIRFVHKNSKGDRMKTPNQDLCRTREAVISTILPANSSRNTNPTDPYH